MPLDAQIPLMGQQPQIAPPVSPLDSLAKVLQVKNAMAQGPIQAQQLQAATLENQQRQQAITDQKTSDAAFKGAFVTDGNGVTTLDRDKLVGALQGHQIPGVMKTLDDMDKSRADLQKTQQEVQVGQATHQAGVAQAIQNAGNDPTFALGTLKVELSNKTITPQYYKQITDPINQAMAQDPTGAAAKAVVKQLTDTAIASAPPAWTEAHAKQVDAAGNAALNPGKQALQGPELEKAKADATLATAKANLTKLTPEQWSAQAMAVTQGTDPSYQRMIQSRLQFAANNGDVEGAKKILDEAAEYAAAPGKAKAVQAAELGGKIAAETDPRVLAARTQQAVQTAKALREGDNPAFANVPPAQAQATQAASIKLDQDYAKSKASADSIKTVLDLAAANNKAAGANAPLVGVGAVNAVNGIKRINSAEIAQYGTAGSLLDKIQGKLQGWTEGQPIPKDVLDDMATLHQALRSSSYQQYTDGLKSLNLRSGAKLQPAFDPPAAASGGKAAPAVGTVQGGYKFKGGDPADQNNWQKAP
jgi:hypothetical protein